MNPDGIGAPEHFHATLGVQFLPTGNSELCIELMNLFGQLRFQERFADILMEMGIMKGPEDLIGAMLVVQSVPSPELN